MSKFRNKYRIESSRLQKWDYGWDAAYFITICTKNRIHYFGEVEDGKMILSNIGVLADDLWHEIKNHAKNVEFGAFVAMPNHIHGILVLDGNNRDRDVEMDKNTDTPGQRRFQNQGKNTVSSIIGSYKSAVTKHAHRLGYEFNWQSRFDDRIIRDDASYQRIVNYINNNPANWEKDIFSKDDEA